ncbi:MAG: type IV pilus assembly protein PilM [Gammaproteobacteria bacterium]|jgi:type IV pilus assembly protein PilM
MQINNSNIKKYLEFFGVITDPIIGIDLGSSAVKVMELTKKNDRYCIQNFAVEYLQVGNIIEKNIRNKEAVTKALTKALAKSKISSNLGCICIPSSAVISKIIQLELGISDKEISNEIALEADRYIPYELDEVNLDFEVLGPSKTGNNLMDVLLVASKKENINTRLSILEDAGINTKIVDVESLSLERVFSKLVVRDLPEQGVNKVIALLDVGATSTSLNIFDDLRSVYTKDQAFGGQQLLDEIQKRYGLTLQEAILARKYGDLPEDYNVDVLEPFRVKIAQQIVRSCQLFLSSSEYKKIDYIVLTGGTSNLAGIDDLVRELLQIKVFIANPFPSMAVADHIVAEELNDVSAGLLTCCGLALRNFQERT